MQPGSVVRESIGPHHLHLHDLHYYHHHCCPLLLFYMWAQKDTHVLLFLSGHFIIWADVRDSLELGK